MEISEVRAFCETFYLRFSTLDLNPFQLKFYSTPDLVSIALINKKETSDSEAAGIVGYIFFPAIPPKVFMTFSKSKPISFLIFCRILTRSLRTILYTSSSSIADDIKSL